MQQGYCGIGEVTGPRPTIWFAPPQLSRRQMTPAFGKIGVRFWLKADILTISELRLLRYRKRTKPLSAAQSWYELE